MALTPEEGGGIIIQSLIGCVVAEVMGGGG
jgi:hypothetical protein